MTEHQRYQEFIFKLSLSAFLIAAFTLLANYIVLGLNHVLFWHNHLMTLPLIGFIIGAVILIWRYKRGKVSSYDLSYSRKALISGWAVGAILMFVCGVIWSNVKPTYTYSHNPFSVYTVSSPERNLEFKTSTSTFNEKSLQEHKGTSYLVFFRFDCPYCAQGMPYLLAKLNADERLGRGDKGIQFIDISTSEGTRIGKRYGVTKANTIIGINDSGKVISNEKLATDGDNAYSIIVNRSHLDKVASSLSH